MMIRTTKLLNIFALLVVILLLAPSEFAWADKVCGDLFRVSEDELRSVHSFGELQGVRINLAEAPGRTPYDIVAKRVNWRDVFGKRLLVSFKYPDGASRRVSQTAYSWDQAIRLYPRLASIGKPILEIHHKLEKYTAKNWKVKALGLTLRVLGYGPQFKEYLRKAPGELGQVAVIIGDEQISTPILSGVLEGQGQVGNGEDPFSSLLVSSKQLREDLPAFVEKSIAAGANRDDLRADVVIFHTHPNVAAPLSREDADVLASTQQEFTKKFPYISFRFLVVAAAKLDTQGDLVFIKEVTVPATAQLK